MAEIRKVCRTPTPGKQATTIPAWKYDVIRAAILEVVPKSEPGIMAKELPHLLSSIIKKDVKEILGSMTWHTTTVKLNMEVEGELIRVKGLRPQHLVLG